MVLAVLKVMHYSALVVGMTMLARLLLWMSAHCTVRVSQFWEIFSLNCYNFH